MRLNGRGAHGLGDRNELGGPIPAIAGPKAHLVAVLEGEDAKAIVLQLVNPAVALWHLVGEGRLARDDKTGR